MGYHLVQIRILFMLEISELRLSLYSGFQSGVCVLTTGDAQSNLLGCTKIVDLVYMYYKLCLKTCIIVIFPNYYFAVYLINK